VSLGAKQKRDWKVSLLLFHPLWVTARETREGWPLLSVETEANRDSSSTYERGSFLGLVRRAFRAGAKDFRPALATPVGPLQNIISSPYTIHFIFPHHPASWAGSLAGSPVS